MATRQPEGLIVDKIIKTINRHPRGRARKVHGNIYVAGEPDIDACIDGRCIKIEVKVPGKAPTALQLHRLDEWRQAGAVAFWCTSLDAALVAFAEAGIDGF